MNILLLVYLVSTSTGVIITDNVLFYQGDLKIIAFSIGDTITIDRQCGDTIFVHYNGKTGTLLQGVLIDLGISIAEAQLFMFARGYYDEGAFPQAARLFVHFLHFFPGSRFYPEALLYSGLTLEALARQGADYDTVSSITKNEQTGKYYYPGTVYKQILEQFPASSCAGSAAYRFILCQRAANEPWNGSLVKIKQDLNSLQDLVDTYGEFNERAAALEEIGYVNRVLYELTGASSYQDRAIIVFETVIQEYPATVHEASARVHLYEIEAGIPIYLY